MLYTYDDADQLLSVTHKNSDGATLFSYTYQYDNVGNRTRMTEAGGGQTDYTYDDLYRLTGVTYPDLTTASYTYNDVGNRTQLVDSSGTTNYTYDNADRLLSAGTTTYYFYDGFNALVETNSSGVTVARYTSGLWIDEWISMDRGGASYCYSRDGLGSIVGLIDAGQATVATYQYDAFGVIKSQTGNVINPYKFTGREYDVESGLYY